MSVSALDVWKNVSSSASSAGVIWVGRENRRGQKKQMRCRVGGGDGWWMYLLLELFVLGGLGVVEDSQSVQYCRAVLKARRARGVVQRRSVLVC